VLALSTERTIQQFAVIMFAARIVAHAVLKLTPPPDLSRKRGYAPDYIAPNRPSAKMRSSEL
jgi:hypothetical protein